MSKPKLLTILDNKTDSVAYSKLNNIIEVTQSGTSLIASGDISINGTPLITFKSPCNCTDVTTMTINGVQYTLVDASGTSISGTSNIFVQNAYVSVVLDSAANKAYIQNSANNPTISELYTSKIELSQQKGVAGGIATLGDDGLIPSSQLPEIGGHYAGASAPSNTNLLWINTNNNTINYYDGSNWKAIGAVFG